MVTIGRKWAVIGLCAVVAVALGGAAVVADDPDEKVEVRKGKIRIVTTDDEGNSDEKVFEFGPGDPRPFLGVMTGRAEDGGVRVEEVIADTGADRAGLQQGDVIVGIDGKTLEGPWDLTARILQSQPGDRVDLEVLRDGERMTLAAEIGEREGTGLFGLPHIELEHLGDHLEHLDRLGDMDFDFDFDLAPHMRHLHFGGRPKLGVELVQPTADLREHYGAPRDAGVIVARIIPGTPAETADLRVGDLIVSADSERVKDAGDLIHALRDKDGQTVRLELVRDGSTMTVDVFIPEAEDEELDSPRVRFGPARAPGLTDVQGGADLSRNALVDSVL